MILTFYCTHVVNVVFFSSDEIINFKGKRSLFSHANVHVMILKHTEHCQVHANKSFFKFKFGFYEMITLSSSSSSIMIRVMKDELHKSVPYGLIYVI